LRAELIDGARGRSYVHGVNTPDQRVLALEQLQFQAIRLIESQPSVTQRQLASALGVSVGRANYCVRALVEKGLVKMRNYRNSENKSAYLYLLTPRGLRSKGALARRFLERKVHEYDALALEIDRLRREASADSRTSGSRASA